MTEAFVRTKDISTHHMFHSYEACPNCNGHLGKPSVAYSRQIVDIPILLFPEKYQGEQDHRRDQKQNQFLLRYLHGDYKI